MQCYWQELLNILPPWIRSAVDSVGRHSLLEIRMRENLPLQMIFVNESQWIDKPVMQEDLRFCINAATKFSPWTAGTITEGYVTAPGGHRIGICGDCVYDGNSLKNISGITSVCIRVARDFADVSGNIYMRKGSILIIGSPGTGKTTFLRDLIRKTSNKQKGSVAVIDERRELFPTGKEVEFDRGRQTDVFSGCRKIDGIEMVLRTMNPSVIAIDEITSENDCVALSRAAWCGVRLMATAHAGDKRELFERVVYKPILERRIFETLIILRSDKTWQEEYLYL